MLTASAAPAVAEPAADDIAAAKRHYKRGETLYALARFDEALAAYREAYKRAPLPKLLINIAQAQRQLKNFAGAIFSLEKYLELAPKASNRGRVEQTLVVLRRERAKQRAEANKRLPPVAQGPPKPPSKRRPIYKRWWFIAGGVALTGATVWAVTRGGRPGSDLGVVDFNR